MIKKKEPAKKVKKATEKIKEPAQNPLTYETVEFEGEMQTKITYPDGRVEYREL